MQALAPTETFKLSIKLALFAGIVVSFPLLFYFIAQFVFPGLTEREKGMLWPALSIGFGLFIVGVAFAYRVVSVEALKFFTKFSANLDVIDQWKIGDYASFVTQLILVFGLCFELPVVVMALVKLDLLTADFMRRTRSYAVIIILVVAAIITPTPDAFVLMLLSGPMIILYEICIWLAWFLERKEKKKEQRQGSTAVSPAGGITAAASTPYRETSPDDPNRDPCDGDHDPYHDHDHGDHDPYDHGHDGYYDDYYRDEADKAAEPSEGDSGDTVEPSGPSDLSGGDDQSNDATKEDALNSPNLVSEGHPTDSGEASDLPKQESDRREDEDAQSADDVSEDPDQESDP